MKCNSLKYVVQHLGSNLQIPFSHTSKKVKNPMRNAESFSSRVKTNQAIIFFNLYDVMLGNDFHDLI